MWGRRANESLIQWIDNDAETLVSGQHDGYAELDDPVIHKREIRLDKISGKLSVSDNFLCKSDHTAKLYFHFDPSCSVEELSPDTLRIIGPFGEVHFSTASADVELLTPNDEPGPGWISTGYHAKHASTSAVIRLDIAGDTKHDCQFILVAH